MWLHLAILTSLTSSLLSCQGERLQSVLHPASDAAEHIAKLWWFMLIICGLVFVFVVLMLAIALTRQRQLSPRPPLGETKFIVINGVLMPTVVMLMLLIYSMSATVALRSEDTAFTIEVIGHKWWWEVRYPEFGVVTANEIHIPVNQKIKLELSSADVIHSFWVPELQGKTDMLPEIVNEAWIAARRPGEFRGQCAEYCGLQHAHMAFTVVALSQREFDDWLAESQLSAPEPETEDILAGYEVFFAAACDSCHAIAGTPAEGRAGPDLTHIASRRTLGAGTVENNRGNLSGWLSDPQHLKPGNLMPRTYLEPKDLHNLVLYLESLR